MEPCDEFIFQQSTNGILVVDQNGYLLRLNPAAAALLGHIEKDAIGQPVVQLFKHIRPLVSLMMNVGPQETEMRLPNSRVVSGKAGDVVGGRVVLLEDITERRDMDLRREALSKAIAHDLRNPLNALAGYVELVEKLGDLNDQQTKFLGRVQQTIHKLYEMAAKLVDLAWLESGMPLAQVPVELMKLTREVIAALGQEARAKELVIINSIPDELPTVVGDAVRLKMAIYNLLDNAIRYSPEGGSIIVHAWLKNDEVFYTVADRGIGIGEEEQDKIWGRLWRSSDERIREIPGGGIGLAFTQKIILRHGGKIWVESKLGEGSSFTFRLPLSK